MCKILVVDDEPDVRDLVRVTLSAFGHEVQEAENGRAALELLADDAQAAPCVALVDLRMPVMDGWDLLAAIHSHARWKNIPVIVFSASINHGSPEPVLRARAYWTKPPPLEHLEGIHEYGVHHREMGRLQTGVRKRLLESEEPQQDDASDVPTSR